MLQLQQSKGFLPFRHFSIRTRCSPQADAATLQEVNKESRADTKACQNMASRIAMRWTAITVASCRCALCSSTRKALEVSSPDQAHRQSKLG